MRTSTMGLPMTNIFRGEIFSRWRFSFVYCVYGNKIEDNYVSTMDPILFTCYDIDDPKTMLGGLSIADLNNKKNISTAS